MATYALVRNPRKVAIYDCPKRNYSAMQVRALTGCDLVINGGLYELATGNTVSHLRIDGKTLANEEWSRPGFGWNSGTANIKMLEARDMGTVDNFIDCVDLIMDGEPRPLQYDAGLSGARPRTAWATLPDGSMLAFASRDTVYTPEELQALMEQLGALNALMLDGGTSTQLSCREQEITTDRCTRNYVCFWGDVELYDTPEDFVKGGNNMSDNRISVQLWAKSDALKNGTLRPKGIMVHSTATPGVSAQEFHDRWDAPNVGASVHFFVDDQDIIQCLNLSKKAGHAGGAANSTHIAFEMCEPSGIRYNSSGSAITSYNPPSGYFAKIWDNAVWLCAYLCKQYGFDPMDKRVLLCHSEGHAQGIATNHADVMHWFPKEGLDMDDFRAAVKALMEEPDPEPVPDPDPETKVLYKVQVGAFTKKPYAEALAKELQDKGYQTYLTQVDGYYKVQLGAFSKPANARRLAAELEGKGYQTYIVETEV